MLFFYSYLREERRPVNSHNSSPNACLTPNTANKRLTAKLMVMRLDELAFELPSRQIAQRPLERRDASRLLRLDRSTREFADRMFAELPNLLRGDELVVLNNTRVIPARLFGRRAGVHSDPPSKATRSEHL